MVQNRLSPTFHSSATPPKKKTEGLESPASKNVQENRWSTMQVAHRSHHADWMRTSRPQESNITQCSSRFFLFWVAASVRAQALDLSPRTQRVRLVYRPSICCLLVRPRLTGILLWIGHYEIPCLAQEVETETFKSSATLEGLAEFSWTRSQRWSVFSFLQGSGPFGKTPYKAQTPTSTENPSQSPDVMEEDSTKAPVELLAHTDKAQTARKCRTAEGCKAKSRIFPRIRCCLAILAIIIVWTSGRRGDCKEGAAGPNEEQFLRDAGGVQGFPYGPYGRSERTTETPECQEEGNSEDGTPETGKTDENQEVGELQNRNVQTPESRTGALRQGYARLGSSNSGCCERSRTNRTRSPRRNSGRARGNARGSGRTGASEIAARGKGRKQKESRTDSTAAGSSTNVYATDCDSPTAGPGCWSQHRDFTAECQDPHDCRGSSQSQSGKEGQDGPCGKGGEAAKGERPRTQPETGLSGELGLDTNSTREDCYSSVDCVSWICTVSNDLRKGWNEIAALRHFAGSWLPRITLDNWNVCSGRNASVYEELRFHNGRIDSVGTGLQHLTLHINLNPPGHNGRASNEKTALYRYFLLQNLFGNLFGTEVFENGTPSGIIKCSWLSFRKVFSFDSVFGVFWYTRSLNKYDGDLLAAILAIIVRDAFGLSLGPATEDAVFSFVSPDMHLLSEHSLEEIAAEQYLLFEGWLERLKPDLDPRFVNHLWISTAVWISTFVGFLLCLLGIELKNRICRWWYHRPGRCRLCVRRRLPPCRKPHAPRSIQRLILFGWLLTSSHAFEPLRNFCEIDNVSTLPRNKTRDSEHFGRSESRTTESDTPPEHGQANLDPGHSLFDNEIVPNIFLNWSEHWSDFCASTGSLIRTETGSVAYHEGTVAAAPSNSDPSVRQEITFEVENTDQSGDPIEDGTCFMQAPVLGRGETCGRHIDPLVYWDRLAFRPPIISTRFYVWKTTPYRVGILQQQLFQIPWDGQSCIRCATAAVTDFAETNIMCGPYYIRPQPEPIDGAPTLQFILTTAPKLVMQRAIHIKVQTDQGVRQGTMVLNTMTGIIGIPVIFDSALPSNRCRTTSWCRVTKRFLGQHSVRWWPDNVLLDDYTHLEIAEIDSQPAYLQTVVALPPTQAFVCQQSNTDPGSTSYEDDHTSLLAFETSQAHEDDTSSLMHAPNFDADRSHSDDSETSRTSSLPSMQTSNRMHEDDTDSLEDSDALLVFGRHLEPELIPIGPQTPVDMHRLSVAQHFGLSQSPGESDSLSIYYVRPRPEDLAQCIIPILATFKNERTLDTSIILVDIELRSNKPRACDSSPEEPYTLRETWFVPVVLTRAAFIHWIGFKELCKQVALPCITQYGYHAWFQQDVTPMPIPDGILLRIIVPIPNPDIPMPFYVDYSRANIPFDQMHAHFLQQQRQAALRVAELFPTDDEMVSQAAQSAPAAQNDGTDFTSLAQTSKKLAPTTMPGDPDPALGDAHCLMMNAPVSVTPSLRRQILVIYEYDFPPTTTSIDPSLPFAQFRHAIGTLMEIESALDWGNFLVSPVRPRPPHIDPLTHESYLLIMPQHIRPGCVHLVVRLQLYWEYDDCLKTEEHSEIKVLIFAQWLDRESFLAHAHFRDLCSLSGRDKSIIHVAGQLWQSIDFESRYLFDGMQLFDALRQFEQSHSVSRSNVHGQAGPTMPTLQTIQFQMVGRVFHFSRPKWQCSLFERLM